MKFKHFILALYCCCCTAFATCEQAEYRQFDFWLGQWQVTTAQDNIVRYNDISKVNQGCSLLEQYRTPSGYVGKSLNGYDKISKRWWQTWMDSSGQVLQLSGGLQQNSMVLTGVSQDKTQRPVLNKITWTPNPDGSVRQHWQVSADQGKHWRTVFDGLYRKVSATAANS